VKGIDVYSLTEDELEVEVNSAKNLILSILFNDNVITAEQYKHYRVNYAIIIKKPSFFSRLWKKVRNADDKQYVIVRQFMWVDDKIDLFDDKKPVDEKQRTDLKILKFEKDKK